ncbi:hypothetical protein GQ472_07150 [archaeon]|nr:hypothetical protein [archaeon]
MKLVTLLSGGIDSPVATHLMLDKGCDIIAVHMDNNNFTDNRSLEKVKTLLKTIAKHRNTKIKLCIAKHGPTLSEIMKKCDRKLTCVLCKRFMYRIAEEIAKKEKAEGIITGESMGQVASQTLDNLHIEDSAVNTRILRPLIGLDKTEIIDIAKEIGTYDISILPEQCCSQVPKFPETHGKLKEIEIAESKIDVKALVKKSVESVKIIEIS